ncbi:MAG TPA: hypothetical protein PK156_41690 [Polyangium sp.]|nr:hypothetical protein [Polyangium sp.]
MRQRDVFNNSFGLRRGLDDFSLEKLIDRTRVPVVFFFNKRDVPDVIPVVDLDKALGVNGAPSFEGNATEKAGTVAVKAAVRAAILRHQGKPFW